MSSDAMAPNRDCVVSYHHEPHGDCPGRDGTTCIEPTCYETATTGFVGRKPDADDLAYLTCSTHKMPVAFGLVRFGLIAEADFEASL